MPPIRVGRVVGHRYFLNKLFDWPAVDRQRRLLAAWQVSTVERNVRSGAWRGRGGQDVIDKGQRRNLQPVKIAIAPVEGEVGDLDVVVALGRNIEVDNGIALLRAVIFVLAA